MAILFLALIFPGVMGSRSLPIDYQFDRGMDHQFLQLTPDSILIHQYSKLIEVNLDGVVLGEVAFEDGFEVANFAYIPHMDLVAVVLGKKDELDYSTATYQVRLYDRSNWSYITVYDPTLLPEDPGNFYVRQFLSTREGHLYVNLWDRDYLEEDGPLLAEADLLPFRDGYGISLGKPFHLQQKAFEPFPGSFKMRWIVSNDNELLVVNQLQPVLKSYSTNERGKNSLDLEVKLYLEGWEQPYYKSKNLSREGKMRWRFSFSRNVGLYNYGGDLLLGTMNPNLQHVFYKRPGTEGRENVAKFILSLQRLNPNGKLVGKPLTYQGAWLIGVHESSAYVLLPPGQGPEPDLYSILRVELQ